MLVLGVVGDAYATSFLDSLPSVSGLDSAGFRGDTLIYDRQGVLLADFGNQGDHRLNVNLDQVSPRLIQATVAIEDRTFWTNPGFDPQGILRAALANLTRRQIVGGGSTITQQLAKQLFLTPDQTYERKLKEVALAYRLNRTYSKRQILELYLNQNDYGEQQYGVQAASLTYFHRPAKELDLAQSALLAGLPQSPSLYDPVVHFQAAKARQLEVLEAMVRAGYITAEQAQQAYAEPLQVFSPVNVSLAPHFVEYVKSELERLGFKAGQQQLLVTTTLDYGKQQLAETVVRDNLSQNLYRDRGGQLNSALVSLDPRTGQILAYVGSPDIHAPGGQYDYVGSDQYRNPGSSLKPFTYAAAISQRRITMDTPIADSPSPLVVPPGPGYGELKVYNYDRRSHGVQPARVALASSLNIPAVKVELAVGVPSVLEYYRQVGLRPLGQDGDPQAPPTQYGPTLTLGGHAVRLLDEATAYAVIADLGMYHPPEAILKVTDVKGHVLYQADPHRGERRAMDPGVAFIVASILSDDNNRALIFGHNSPLHLVERHSAAKTGTTDSFKDALTAGFTPDLVTVVWVGDTLGITHTMSAGSDGVYVAAPAWHRFMVQALQGVPDHWYDPPSDVVKGPGNSWYLKDATQVAGLPGDQPTPSPSPTDYGIPPDPGTGPVLQPSPKPKCLPPLPCT